MELEVFRGNDVVAKIPVGGKNGRFTYGLMNAHKIVVNDVKQYDALQVQIEDYVVRKGTKFKVNTVPDLNADDQLSYSIIFEGHKYTWHDKLFMDEGEADIPGYYGNALLLMELFITNINEIDPGWSLREIADTPEKHLVFSNVTCHEAILIIAEAFNLEFQEQEKAITMVPKIGRDTNLSFEYGMGKGLYNLTRTYVSDKNVVTKVYGFGGNRNIPVGYRGAKRKLTFDPGYHTNNIELYGIKEGQYTNPDIIPEREAAVTGATFGNPLSTITDLTLDFNIKDCVIEGLEPKIGFTSGSLSGEEFVITDYNPTTKTITYKGFINDNNVVLPNVTYQAQVGDKYVLLDIELPEIYVTANEARVDADTLEYVIENSVPRVEYGGTIDPIHLRDNSIELIPGDRVNFKDARIGLDATIRITEISMPLDFPEVISDETTIEITIANFVTYSSQQRLRDEKLIQKHEIKKIDIRSAEQARRNSANLLNLRDSVIDPEGNYYSELIKPRSIESLMLSIGAVATNFDVSGVAFTPNYLGNPNDFTASSGQLIHYALELPGKTFIWEMQPFSITGLVSANKYFLYAKISKSTNVGSWELSTEVMLAESLAGYWILQAGVLFPEKDGYRNNKITSGMVFIVGNQITAGRMMSIDESMFIDLTNGQLKLGDDQYGMDWNVTTPKRLTIRGGITQNAGGIMAPIALFRGPYVAVATYYKGDTVVYNGETWAFKSDNPATGQSPVENTYWTIVAKKGMDGADGSNGANGTNGADGNYTEFRFAKNGSTSLPPAIVVSNPNPTGWTTAQPILGPAEFAYITSAIKTTAGSLVTNWSTPIRYTAVDGAPGANGSNGATGPAGSTGAQGPFMNFRGDYDPAKSYLGSTANIQSVKYLGNYYITRTDAGTIPNGTIPTNGAYWNSFGGQFESLATGLLLAELAYIKNLGVENLKTADSGRRVEITKAGNNISFFAGNETTPAVKIDANIPNPASDDTSEGLWVQTSLGMSTIAAAGVFANGSSLATVPGSTGLKTNASIFGLLNKRNTTTLGTGISAAISARDSTTDSDGNSTSFAIYANGGVAMMGAQYEAYAETQGDYALTGEDYRIVGLGSGANTVYLPNKKRIKGRIIVVKNLKTSAVMNINGNGMNIFTGSSTVGSLAMNPATAISFVFDGSKWIAI